MATMTRTDATNTATYVITDNGGNTLTVVVTINSILGNTFALTTSGNLMSDGMAMFNSILLPLATGVVPVAQNQAY